MPLPLSAFRISRWKKTMRELDGCRIGDVVVRFDGNSELEFRSTSTSCIALLHSERKALTQLSRVRKMFSLSNSFICEPSGSLLLDDDGCTTLRLLLPHASPSWVPLNCVESSIRCRVLSIVADQLCDWHSVGVTHRTVSPNCILVDTTPPASANTPGPAVVLLHWACSSIFDSTSDAFTVHANLPHLVPSYAAPERLRWGDSSPPSPSEDFYGLGVIVKNYSADDVQGDSSTPTRASSPIVSSPSTCNNTLTSDELWQLLISNQPASTVLEFFLQPDRHLRAFNPSCLQKLIETHGSEVFATNCMPLVANQTTENLLGILSETSGDSNVASVSWIQTVVGEIMHGKCVSASLCREILKMVVIGVTSKKEIVAFLHKLLQDRVLSNPCPWFTCLKIEALSNYDFFVEKIEALVQQYSLMHPSIQTMLLHMAVCPYFIPYDELVGIVQVRDGNLIFFDICVIENYPRKVLIKIDFC